MECDHKSKVLDWAYELKDGQMNQYVSLYGCTECDATSRKWEGELKRYKEARRQGIQPAGTTMDKIIAAEKASENLGRAYNAEKDPNAKHINKQTAKTINELGA
jgi:hypothetical protein